MTQKVKNEERRRQIERERSQSLGDIAGGTATAQALRHPVRAMQQYWDSSDLPAPVKALLGVGRAGLTGIGDLAHVDEEVGRAATGTLVYAASFLPGNDPGEVARVRSAFEHTPGDLSAKGRAANEAFAEGNEFLAGLANMALSPTSVASSGGAGIAKLGVKTGIPGLAHLGQAAFRGGEVAQAIEGLPLKALTYPAGKLIQGGRYALGGDATKAKVLEQLAGEQIAGKLARKVSPSRFIQDADAPVQQALPGVTDLTGEVKAPGPGGAVQQALSLGNAPPPRMAPGGQVSPGGTSGHLYATPQVSGDVLGLTPGLAMDQPEKPGDIRPTAQRLLSGGFNRFADVDPIAPGTLAPRNAEPDKAAIDQFAKNVKAFAKEIGHPPPANLNRDAPQPDLVRDLEYNEQFARLMGADAIPTTPDEYYRLVSTRSGSINETPLVPTVALQLNQSPQALKGFFAQAEQEMPGVMEAARHGLEFRDTMAQVRQQGRLTKQMVAKTWLWTMLSNNAAPFPHEGNFIMASNQYLNPLLDQIDRGFATPEEAQRFLDVDVEAFVQLVGGRQGSNIPGAKAREAGRAVPDRVAALPYQLRRAFGAITEWQQSGALDQWTALLNRPDLYDGRKLRREFYRLNMGGEGVDNKLLSFNLLLNGLKDVFVIDIIQGRNLHEEGFQRIVMDALGASGPVYSDAEIATRALGTKDKKLLTTATDRAAKPYGNKLLGLVRYEVLEDLLKAPATAVFGEPDLAALHWYLWVMRDWRAVDHGSLGPSLLAAIEGFSQPGQGYSPLPGIRTAAASEGLPWRTAMTRYFFPGTALPDVAPALASGARPDVTYHPAYHDPYYAQAVSQLQKQAGGKNAATAKEAQAALRQLQKFAPNRRARWDNASTEVARQALLNKLVGEKKPLGTGYVPSAAMEQAPRLRPRFTEQSDPLLKSRDLAEYPLVRDPNETLGQALEPRIARSVVQGDPGDYAYETTFGAGTLGIDEIKRKTGVIPQEFGYPGSSFEEATDFPQRQQMVREIAAELQRPESGLRKHLNTLGLRVEFNPSYGSDSDPKGANRIAANVVFMLGAFDHTGNLLGRGDLISAIDGVAASFAKALKQRAYVWSVPATSAEAGIRKTAMAQIEQGVPRKSLDPQVQSALWNINFATDVRLPRDVTVDQWRAALPPEYGFTQMPNGVMRVLNLGDDTDSTFYAVIEDTANKVSNGRAIIDSQYSFGKYVEQNAEGTAYDDQINQLAQGVNDVRPQQTYGGFTIPAAQPGAVSASRGGAGVGAPQGTAARREAVAAIHALLGGISDGLDARVLSGTGGAVPGGNPPLALPTRAPLGGDIAAGGMGLTPQPTAAVQRQGQNPAQWLNTPVLTGVPGGTRLGMMGSTGLLGAGVGYTQGDTGEERRQNAIQGFGTGAALSGALTSRKGYNVLKSSGVAKDLAGNLIKEALAAQHAAMNRKGQGFAALRQLPSVWKVQATSTLRNLLQDEGTARLWLADAGVRTQMMNDNWASLVELYNQGVRDPYLSLPQDTTTVLDALGLTGYIPKVGASFTEDNKKLIETLSAGDTAKMEALLAGLNPLRAGIPIAGIGLAGVKGYTRAFQQSLFDQLNQFTRTASRHAAFQDTIEKELPGVADAFIKAHGGALSALKGQNGLFSPEQVELLMPGLGDLWKKNVDTVVGRAEARAKDILGDYAKKLPGEKTISTVLPFSSYALRAYPRTAKMMLHHPGMSLVFMMLMAKGANYADQQDLPGYLAGTLPVGTDTPVAGGVIRAMAGGQDATGYVNVASALSPVGGALIGGDDMPEDANLYQKAGSVAGRLGFGFNPVGQGIATALNKDYRLPSAPSRTAAIEEALPGPEVPSITQGPINFVREQAGGTPLETTSLDRRIAQVFYEATGHALNDPAVKKNPQLARLAASTLDPDSPIVQEAKSRELQSGVARTTVGMASPVSVSARTDIQRVQDRARADVKDLPPAAYDPAEVRQMQQSRSLADQVQAMRMASANRGTQATPPPEAGITSGVSRQSRAYAALAAWQQENRNLKYWAPNEYAQQEQQLRELLGIQ